jgi:hypothetical protein
MASTAPATSGVSVGARDIGRCSDTAIEDDCQAVLDGEGGDHIVELAV